MGRRQRPPTVMNGKPCATRASPSWRWRRCRRARDYFRDGAAASSGCGWRRGKTLYSGDCYGLRHDRVRMVPTSMSTPSGDLRLPGGGARDRGRRRAMTDWDGKPLTIDFC